MTQGLVRRGDRVLRPLGFWSPAVHEYLRHLESVGFAGAPRVLDVEGGREVLTYLDGEVAVDPVWQPGRGHRLPDHARGDEALIAAGRLIRDLHQASRGFHPITSTTASPPARLAPARSSPTVTSAPGTPSAARACPRRSSTST